MSLYLKYRPQDFDNLIWQEIIKTTLLNSSKAWKISHAYLFTWPRWTWKTTTARLIAKTVNCLDLRENWTPCWVCTNCESISNWNFVDLIEIDAASNTWVDNVRDIQSKIGFSPNIWKKKVYILDEAHMLSKWAWNALLKTIEEPPSFVHFIFVTTEISKIPETIVSRCISFNFKIIDELNLVDRLKFICENEWFKYENQALEIISEQAGGWMRDAISLLEKISSEWEVTQDLVIENLWLAKNSIVKEFLKYIFGWDKKNALRIINELASKAYDLNTFNEEVLLALREMMLDSSDNQKEIHNIIEVITLFVNANDNFKISVIPQLPLEIACLKAIYYLNPNIESWESEILEKISKDSKEENIEIETLHQDLDVKEEVIKKEDKWEEKLVSNEDNNEKEKEKKTDENNELEKWKSVSELGEALFAS